MGAKQTMKVFFVQHSSEEPIDICQDWERAQIITLSHPKYENTNAQFLLNQKTCELLQIQSTEHKNGFNSWFIAHKYVISDGRLFVATPYDVSFLMLPLLEKVQFAGTRKQEATHSGDYSEQATGLYCDAEYIISNCFQNDEDLISMMRPLVIKYKCLDILCETKNVSKDGTKVYRINEERVLKWLKIKLQRISASLLSGSFLENSDTKSFRKTLKKPDSQSSSNEELEMRAKVQAFKILSDNVSIKWLKKLAEIMNLTTEVYGTKTESFAIQDSGSHSNDSLATSESAFESSSSKKRKLELKNKKTSRRKTTESRASASLKKVDTSKMKSITSFFSLIKKDEK